MKVAKSNTFKISDEEFDPEVINRNFRQLEEDLEKLFTCLKGRVRFGTGTDGDRGENIHGEFQTFTSDAVADTEFSFTHTLGSIPIGYIVLAQDKAGTLYQLPTTGTDWNATTVYLKCDVASVTFNVFLLK